MAHSRSLAFPGFPVESCGFRKLRVVLFGENHIRGPLVRAGSRKSGYARDDKKKRIVARKGRSLEERAVA
jgi:hypothetical protein